MATDISSHTKSVYLTAALCNAQLEMPMPVLTQMVIDIATEHANILNIGYARLVTSGAAWVLSRITVDMNRFPHYNESFSITTWIISLNRFYSERAIRFDDEKGNVLGYVRTTWVAIDIKERRPVNLVKLFPEGVPMPDIEMPLAAQGRIPKVEADAGARSHTFLTSDIDCNRHVNTNRYVEQIINCFDLDYYDAHRIAFFDISFHAEALYGEKVNISHTIENENAVIEITDHNDKLCTSAIINFAER